MLLIDAKSVSGTPCNLSMVSSLQWTGVCDQLYFLLLLYTHHDFNNETLMLKLLTIE